MSQGEHGASGEALAKEEGRGAPPFDLDGMTDDALRELVKRGQALLAAREQERRREALREIQRLAKEHGLNIEVGGPKRKRGRPPSAAKAMEGRPKAKEPSSQP